MLVPNKMQHVICTGNIAREQFNEFCALAPNVHVVRGDFDNEETLPFPEVQVVQVGEFKIGLIHGHQLLPSAASQDAKSRMRRKLDVDILVSGHTHQNEVVLEDGYYHINPVSAPGRVGRICNLLYALRRTPTRITRSLIFMLLFAFSFFVFRTKGINYGGVFCNYFGRHTILHLVGRPRPKTSLLCVRNEQRRGSGSEQDGIYKAGAKHSGSISSSRQ